MEHQPLYRVLVNTCYVQNKYLNKKYCSVLYTSFTLNALTKVYKALSQNFSNDRFLVIPANRAIVEQIFTNDKNSPRLSSYDAAFINEQIIDNILYDDNQYFAIVVWFDAELNKISCDLTKCFGAVE